MSAVDGQFSSTLMWWGRMPPAFKCLLIKSGALRAALFGCSSTSTLTCQKLPTGLCRVHRLLRLHILLKAAAEMNLNLSASLNAARLLFKPSMCLPHHTVSTFNDLPIPLDKGLRSNGYKSDIRAVVLDKDDCFAYPDAKEVYEPYKKRFDSLKEAYPGRKLLVVSNTSGATSWDKDLKQAAEVERGTGVHVLPHAVKKPGCGSEIMEYFRQHPETGVTDPSHIAVVGDRLTTDMMLANMMGSWGFWIKDGVVPMQQKSIFSKMERNLAVFLADYRGLQPPRPHGRVSEF